MTALARTPRPLPHRLGLFRSGAARRRDHATRRSATGVPVLGLAAQDFIADHKYRSRRYTHARNHIHSWRQMEQKFIVERHYREWSRKSPQEATRSRVLPNENVYGLGHRPHVVYGLFNSLL